MRELPVSDSISIPLREIALSAIRAQGAGGQHVNKAATGVHLRFDIAASSLPEKLKQRLLQANDQHISRDGVIIIKSQQTRSQDQNRHAALQLLAELIKTALAERKPRKKTKPTRSSREKRLQAKSRHSRIKELRRKLPKD